MAKTNDVSYHAQVTCYPWINPAPTSVDTASSIQDPVVINEGIHYLSISRSKDIGGRAEIDFRGAIHEASASVGNWIVIRTSATGPIHDKNPGIVRFIGMIYSVNTNYFTDGDGKIGRTFKLSVREWSHVLHIPVRYDLNSVTLNQSQTSAVNSFITNAAKGRDVGESFADIFTKFLDPYSRVHVMLAFVGAVSSSNEKIFHNIAAPDDIRPALEAARNHYEVVSRLPVIPKRLIADCVQTRAGIDAIKEESPWDTGFLWVYSGIQRWKPSHWDKTGKIFVDGGNEFIVSGQQSKRPVSLITPDEVLNGNSLSSILQENLDMVINEFYTDLWYDESGRVKPVLVCRDKPFTMKKFSEEGAVPWTYLDDLPRIEIPLANVLSINITHTSQNSPNYIRCESISSSITQEEFRYQATAFGTKIDIDRQRRFGGQEMVVKIHDTIFEVGDNGEVAADHPTSDWFSEVASKLEFWHGHDFLFYKGTLLIKDANFLLSVGSNIRIDLGEGRPVLIAHIESIDQRYSVEETGRVMNQLYLSVSRMCMEDPQSKELLIPLPRKAAVDLLNIESSDNSGESLLKKEAVKFKLPFELPQVLQKGLSLLKKLTNIAGLKF